MAFFCHFTKFRISPGPHHYVACVWHSMTAILLGRIQLVSHYGLDLHSLLANGILLFVYQLKKKRSSQILYQYLIG